MDIEALTRFFMWCTILNGSLFILWSMFLLLLPEVTYRLQHGFLPIPRETYNVVVYAFLGLFKILFLIFNLVPYLALLILV